MPLFRVGSSKPVSQAEREMIDAYLEERGAQQLDYMVAYEVPDYSLRNTVNRSFQRRPKIHAPVRR